jgi:hypothetical protein
MDYYHSINFTDGDPTDGSVNYLSQSDAMSAGLAKITNNQVYLGVDSTNKAPLLQNGKGNHGRPSIRLESNFQPFSSGLLISDIAHMPGGNGCGLWPSQYVSGRTYWRNGQSADNPPVGFTTLPRTPLAKLTSSSTMNLRTAQMLFPCTLAELASSPTLASAPIVTKMTPMAG